MFGSIGMPELIILLVVGAFWIIPIAAAIWALMTLHRIRAGQQAVQLKLDTIERLLQRS
jgi:hypothetical protein